MPLTLHFHPLSSYCHKVLIALYENDTPFTPNIVNLQDEGERNALLKLWPIGKFPVIEDHARDWSIAESSIIIEYLDRHYPGRTRFLPEDREEALRVRFAERFFDFYVQDPMSKIVTDRIRPEGSNDHFGVEKARAELAAAYDAIEARLPRGMWPAGDAFTLADCAAAPALFYADQLVPIERPRTRAYLDRLLARPSMLRVRREAEPYWHMFPGRRRED